MASYEDREAFIPYRRTDLIELCLEDGKLVGAEAQKFRDFCKLLSAYYHFKFQAYLERLKDNYAPFNPDASTKSIEKVSSQGLEKMETQLVEDFKAVLERANYVPISQKSLERAINKNSLIELKTKVNFNDFDQLVCYCRGDIYKTIEVKKWFFWKEKKTINSFERVALLIKFKDQEHMSKKNRDDSLLKFAPGQMYIYYYKNVPKFDLELLFPNIKISMTWKDRLKLGVPAIGAAIPIILKTLPKLTLLVGAIAFLIFGTTRVLEFIGLNVSEENVRDFMPVLTATLSLVIVLGGYAFKQYSKYKSKLIEFRKKVTDTLFFKNLANNASVFHALIDAAEEEECKEIILVYYHLLTSKKPLTPEQLDNEIEAWMDTKFDTKIDFDIYGPVGNLQEIRGKVSNKNQEETLLTKDAQGNCHVLPLDQAKSLIDHIWDNIFLYT